MHKCCKENALGRIGTSNPKLNSWFARPLWFEPVTFWWIRGKHLTNKARSPLMGYLMWRSDDLLTSHPIFSLVLFNHKVRNQLQKLGSICLNTKDINQYITAPDLKQLLGNDEDFFYFCI